MKGTRETSVRETPPEEYPHTLHDPKGTRRLDPCTSPPRRLYDLQRSLDDWERPGTKDRLRHVGPSPSLRIRNQRTPVRNLHSQPSRPSPPKSLGISPTVPSLNHKGVWAGRKLVHTGHQDHLYRYITGLTSSPTGSTR